MSDKRMLGIMVIIWLTVWGCGGGPSPSNLIWEAQPEFLEVDNQLFNVRITPQQGEYPYFAYFHLTLSNKSDSNLMVDWNASQYLYNGKPQGVLVFEGIDPETIKGATVPSETIAPGASFTRDVMPLRLIAWSPIREEKPDSPTIRPGMLPAGQNGIRLAVRHAKGRMIIPLSVQLFKMDAP